MILFILLAALHLPVGCAELNATMRSELLGIYGRAAVVAGAGYSNVMFPVGFFLHIMLKKNIFFK